MENQIAMTSIWRDVRSSKFRNALQPHSSFIKVNNTKDLFCIFCKRSTPTLYIKKKMHEKSSVLQNYSLHNSGTCLDSLGMLIITRFQFNVIKVFIFSWHKNREMKSCPAWNDQLLDFAVCLICRLKVCKVYSQHTALWPLKCYMSV